MEECFVCTEWNEDNLKYCLFCNYYVCLNCINDLIINFKNICTICKKSIPYGYNSIITSYNIPKLQNPLIGIYLHDQTIKKKYVDICYDNIKIKNVFKVTQYEGGSLLTNYDRLPLEKLNNFILDCNFNKISCILYTFGNTNNNEILTVHDNMIFIVTNKINELKIISKLKYKDVKKYYFDKKKIYKNLVILNNNSLNFINTKNSNSCWNYIKNRNKNKISNF